MDDALPTIDLDTPIELDMTLPEIDLEPPHINLDGEGDDDEP
ncbi:hypothetical protein [Halomonas caseinilytica]|uniref:Uncharacterized protein n=1 Tax=Halomonas caseinilytica TaxID=438744 RepID=A0A1M6Z696_9GAMM|nr:hypothetical protein [Halomonas caseinilytica]SHL25947.1 hypothetical protein SAMN05192556_11039 [Halomonas caseinilytica]